jgi:hypothetical protein
MEPNQAAEHLQTIRTLMERSAVYRRALAPIMIFCGVVGVLGGIAGSLFSIESSRGFVLFWATAAVIALTGSFVLARRQALKDSEPFWSPPTRRVAQALAPALFLGAIVGLFGVLAEPTANGYVAFVPVWCILFGLGIHSAGFFMPRGLKLFGWFFIVAGCLQSLFCVGWTNPLPEPYTEPHWLMGGTFGGLHLAYGIYLYFTEKRGKAS